jgi:hypothetical protein
MASPRIGQGPELMNVVNLRVRDVRGSGRGKGSGTGAPNTSVDARGCREEITTGLKAIARLWAELWMMA